MLNRAKVREMREKLEPLLAEISAKTGIGIQLGRCSFTTTVATFKLECGEDNGGGFDASEVHDFKTHAHLYGLKPEDLGREFVWRGKVYKVVGLCPSRPQYPFLCDGGKNGCRYKFRAEWVRQGLAAAPESKVGQGGIARERGILKRIRQIDVALPQLAVANKPLWKINLERARLTSERKDLVSELGHEPTVEDLAI